MSHRGRDAQRFHDGHDAHDSHNAQRNNDDGKVWLYYVPNGELAIIGRGARRRRNASIQARNLFSRRYRHNDIDILMST